MDWAIVDVQGFKDNNNRFIVKEFYMETKNLRFHDIIKSPTDQLDKRLNKKRRNEVKWLTQHYHGIDWMDGYITIKELQNTVLFHLNNANIYVKGEEKVMWIKQIMNNYNLKCFNVEKFNCNMNLCERKSKIYNNKNHWSCKNHIPVTNTNKNSIQCAIANVKMLRKWFQKNVNEIKLRT